MDGGMLNEEGFSESTASDVFIHLNKNYSSLSSSTTIPAESSHYGPYVHKHPYPRIRQGSEHIVSSNSISNNISYHKNHNDLEERNINNKEYDNHPPIAQSTSLLSHYSNNPFMTMNSQSSSLSPQSKSATDSSFQQFIQITPLTAAIVDNTESDDDSTGIGDEVNQCSHPDCMKLTYTKQHYCDEHIGYRMGHGLSQIKSKLKRQRDTKDVDDNDDDDDDGDALNLHNSQKRNLRSPTTIKANCQESQNEHEIENRDMQVKKHQGSLVPKVKRKQRLCRHSNCVKQAQGPTNFCISHGGGRKCQYPNCIKIARSPTDFCAMHGGGYRCQFKNCTKLARYPSIFCMGHGGIGKRCQHPECVKNAVSPGNHCISHGGGKRCSHENCKSAAIASTSLCKAHGGGRRCKHTDCSKTAIPKSDYCKDHDGD